MKKVKILLAVMVAVLVIVICIGVATCNGGNGKKDDNTTEYSGEDSQNSSSTDGETDTSKQDDETTVNGSGADDETTEGSEPTEGETTTEEPTTEEPTTQEPTTEKPTEKPTEAPDDPAEINKTDFGVAEPTGTLNKITSWVGVHDPSIEYDPVSKKFYIFGSHRAWANSSNLMNWSMTTNNISTNYATIFAKSASWAALGGTQGNASYDVSGNLWAPDVIYNKDMGKWCMYMSVNGSAYYSSIALATADSIDGPYTYQGTVVYSGFDNATQAAMTDYPKVTGSSYVATRYLKDGSWNSAYGTNAIDPCVLYDADGELWMSYGSWFGGLFLLKLDNETGLRDYTYTYETKTNVSDAYLGIKISGGYGCTGEGSYIVWDEEAGYYYLYVSYCGLESTTDFAGYHMRLFRSKNITGPYTDARGNTAICTSAGTDQTVKGVKLMGNYFFTSLTGASGTSRASKGYMSPGHNSAIIDNNGNHYVIYHTRFNKGSEAHQVRVHQQFLNEDGWPVVAPYEYLGSKIKKGGYASSDIVGDYEFINHGLAAATIYTGMLDTKLVTLTADGKITGDVTGSWKQVSKNGKGYYATMVIDGVTYKGVFFKQYDESASHTETMTFTLIGSNNQSIWGSKVTTTQETGNGVAYYDFEDSANPGTDGVGTVGNADVIGGTIVADSERGNVLSFDGVDDYVKLPSKSIKYSGYTIMMWVKSTNVTVWERVFDLGDDSNNSMFFTTSAYMSGYRFAMQVGGTGENQISGSAPMTKDTWTHVALTINKTSKRATLYIGGTKIGTVILPGLPNVFSGSACYLGRSQYSADAYFTGYMDDVYIFDYELSQDKVKEYMNK